MTTVRLTVNGEACSADVPGRTQLAELLRDHLHLTGTHLGCEHGVCGACTVLVDGRPVRSCITYAQACEGADVVTVEGLGDDPVGQALREAFARHHALQCGFCTPGMLITAWDVVTRLAPTDEAAIRHELSGNLCRCTGYMGIVAAVRDVAAGQDVAAVRDVAAGQDVAGQDVAGRHRDAASDGEAAEAVPDGDGATATEGTAVGERESGSALDAAAGKHETVSAPNTTANDREPSRSRAAPAGGTVAEATADVGPGESIAPSVVAFEPFEVDPMHLAGAEATAAGATGTAARPMTHAGGWTLVEREFAIGHPVDALWALFEDLPRVAECLPGVHVESACADRFTGRAEIRFGPIAASFHGEGTRETDAGHRTGIIAGRGSDRRGHASLDAELRYAMSGDDAPGSGPRTRVALAIRFRIQGGLAQFNRSDLVESFADVMLAEFARNCERRLAGKEVRAAAGASGFTLLWRIVKARLGF